MSTYNQANLRSHLIAVAILSDNATYASIAVSDKPVDGNFRLNLIGPMNLDIQTHRGEKMAVTAMEGKVKMEQAEDITDWLGVASFGRDFIESVEPIPVDGNEPVSLEMIHDSEAYSEAFNRYSLGDSVDDENSWEIAYSRNQRQDSGPEQVEQIPLPDGQTGTLVRNVERNLLESLDVYQVASDEQIYRYQSRDKRVGRMCIDFAVSTGKIKAVWLLGD